MFELPWQRLKRTDHGDADQIIICPTANQLSEQILQSRDDICRRLIDDTSAIPSFLKMLQDLQPAALVHPPQRYRSEVERLTNGVLAESVADLVLLDSVPSVGDAVYRVAASPMAAGDQHTSYLLSRRPDILQVDMHDYVVAEEEINTPIGNRLLILAVGRDME